MKKRRTFIFSILVGAILALCLPALAAAQGSYDPYSRNRDYDRDGDYRRDRNQNDNYGYDRYDSRYLRDSIRRLDRLSRALPTDLDPELNHNRQTASHH